MASKAKKKLLQKMQNKGSVKRQLKERKKSMSTKPKDDDEHEDKKQHEDKRQGAERQGHEQHGPQQPAEKKDPKVDPMSTPPDPAPKGEAA